MMAAHNVFVGRMASSARNALTLSRSAAAVQCVARMRLTRATGLLNTERQRALGRLLSAAREFPPTHSVRPSTRTFFRPDVSGRQAPPRACRGVRTEGRFHDSVRHVRQLAQAREALAQGAPRRG